MNGTIQKVVKGSLLDVSQQSGTGLAESFLSANIIIMVDVSGSMEMRDAPGGISRRDAAGRELARLQNERPGKIALVCFDSFPVFSPAGVLTTGGGGTDMAAVLKFVKPADGCGITFFLISDGEPDSPSEALAHAKGFDSTINTVYTGPEKSHGGREFLAKLAAAGGGRFEKSAKPGLLKDSVDRLLLTG